MADEGVKKYHNSVDIIYGSPQAPNVVVLPLPAGAEDPSDDDDGAEGDGDEGLC